MTERLAVALHLVLAAFAERQMEQAALCPGTLEAHGERDRGAVVERQSSPPSVEIGPAHVAGHLGLVQPRQAIAGMEQSMGQRTDCSIPAMAWRGCTRPRWPATCA